MAMEGIVQPESIQVDEDISLRKIDGPWDFALDWYQDPETIWLVDGARMPYTPEKIQRMYSYLENAGELYFIEYQGRLVGDVTFWQEDMPIVIGDKTVRGREIGRRVIAALVQRGRELGFEKLMVEEIYSYNTVSQRAFEAAGFRRAGRTAKGWNHELTL